MEDWIKLDEDTRFLYVDEEGYQPHVLVEQERADGKHHTVILHKEELITILDQFK